MKTRLTSEEQSTIIQCFRRTFSPSDSLWLFGSRTDISRKGGDIDLYVETHLSVEEAVNSKLNFLTEIKLILGEQKIDVVLNVVCLKQELPIYEVAQKEGVRLI